jgi:hypothetical protein
MKARGHRLQQRAEALHFRIRGLTTLRRLVDLPAGLDVTPRQWAILEPQLSAAAAQLTSRLKTATNQLLPRVHNAGARVRLNAALGRIELDLAKGFAFFDTYMDVLTQRRATELGAVLGGCDVLAYDAMRRPHPSLDAIEPPLVYCDRGFGAAIVRESVPFPDGSPNPMPLIQIPYSRLREKSNLTSILHEAGHQSLTRLGLVRKLGVAIRDALTTASAPGGIRDLYALWSFEIGPDFWGFGLSGMAEAASVRDLFAMPPGPALRVSFTDPHPPPYLRTLLTFDWCRRAWGRGPWDEWEREWIELYPLGHLPPGTRRLILDARRYATVVGAALFEAKFPELNGRALVDLFDLDKVSPANVRRLAGAIRSGVLDLRGLSPCAQLAVFSAVRDSRIVSDEYLDRIMTEWLRRLSAQRRVLH